MMMRVKNRETKGKKRANKGKVSVIPLITLASYLSRTVCYVPGEHSLVYKMMKYHALAMSIRSSHTKKLLHLGKNMYSSAFRIKILVIHQTDRHKSIPMER